MANNTSSPFEPLDSPLLEAWQFIAFRRITGIVEAAQVQHMLNMAAHHLLSRHDPNTVSDAVAGRAKIIFALLDRLHLLFPSIPPSPVLHSLELCFLPAFYWVADFNFLRSGSLWSGQLLQDLVHSIYVELQHDLASSLANRIHPSDLKFTRIGLTKVRDGLREHQIMLSSIVDDTLTMISTRLSSLPTPPVPATTNNPSTSTVDASKERPIPQVPPTWSELLQGAPVALQTTSSSNQTMPNVRQTNRALDQARARLEGRQSLSSNVA
ncbi:hypothetical protein CVT24_007874 [Panaeolus cyanescens]|uniref:Uncharacterized protein n=1 Tax=Panaeolus cyanescens TaxID=181874 RepID=A0A409X5E8_9AGAR|nr:hypothetical protein CVT24_007874 [Panaeolus cyanescens]